MYNVLITDKEMMLTANAFPLFLELFRRKVSRR